MSLNSEVSTLVIKRTEKMLECLESKTEFRKCLSLLPSIAFPLRGYIDIANNPDDVFHAYLIIEQLGNVQSAYDGRTEKWYELNRDNVEELKKHLKKFAERLIVSLRGNNEEVLIQSTKEFFFNFHQLATATTRDTRV
jgi:hypothetical protein